MLTNINPYYTQWNTDVNGNPISVHKQEMQQVSPVYFNNAEIVDAANRWLLLWRYKMGIYQALED